VLCYAVSQKRGLGEDNGNYGYLKWARQHPGNKTEHETRAEYDVASSILGTAPAPIHYHPVPYLYRVPLLVRFGVQHSTALCCHFSRKRLRFFNQLSGVPKLLVSMLKFVVKLKVSD